MTSTEAVIHALELLEDMKTEYMLVGAFSSNVYGIPRSTKDADIVVMHHGFNVVEFARMLGEGFQLDRQMKLETITNSLRYVIKYLPTSFDIELFRLNNDSHHRERFARRQNKFLTDLNRHAWIPTAEDVIIQKLRWARRKDLDDAVNVLAVQAGSLDWDYITRWTKEHNTYELLMQLYAELPDLGLLDEEGNDA